MIPVTLIGSLFKNLNITNIIKIIQVAVTIVSIIIAILKWMESESAKQEAIHNLQMYTFEKNSKETISALVTNNNKTLKEILKSNELLRNNYEMLKNEGIKVKNLHSASATILQNNISKDIKLKDTLIYIGDTIKNFIGEYQDNYIKIKQEIYTLDSIKKSKLQIQTIDSIFANVYRKREKKFPKGWKRPIISYGKWKDSASVENKSPYSKINKFHVIINKK